LKTVQLLSVSVTYKHSFSISSTTVYLAYQWSQLDCYFHPWATNWWTINRAHTSTKSNAIPTCQKL